MNRRAFQTACALAASVIWRQSSPAWPFQLDEGERLSAQIAAAAGKLQNSGSAEVTIIYRPAKGVDRHYRVNLAKVRYQPHPPFDPPYPGLTVYVEKGQGGFSNYHVRFVGVPRSLEIQKYGEATEIGLRKVGAEIDVLSLR